MSLRSWIRNLFPSSGRAVPSGVSPHPPAPPARPCPGRSSPGASRLVVEVCEMATEVLVRLRGEAGYLEAAILDAALLPVRARRPALVTFDLSELRFLSSLALGLLVGCHRSAARTGGRVRLIGLRPAVREVMERTGLAMLLLEHDGAQAAGTCEVAATVRAAGPADTLNP